MYYRCFNSKLFKFTITAAKSQFERFETFYYIYIASLSGNETSGNFVQLRIQIPTSIAQSAA
jgi:hypothetical protein